jgi:hypothetical protein
MRHIFLADITSSNWPALFSYLAAFVGLIGILSALVAAKQVLDERKLIKQAGTRLASSESWIGAHTHSEHELNNWLGSLGIRNYSGVADVILTCWSAWLGSRPPALNEIHVLVSRRERTKFFVRLSGGIAALLLVIGICGTLVSVKPVLENFDFKSSLPTSAQTTQEGGLVSVVENIDLINQLMQNLGEAFMPSLVALIATVSVAVFRGGYTLRLHRYTLELDQFAIRTVMPHFRSRSVSDEFATVRSIFESIAKSIEIRENKFERVINNLENFTQNLEPTLNSIGSTLIKMSDAAEMLDSKSRSIAETLCKTLGRQSPLYEVVQNFDSIFKRVTAELNLLSNVALKISKNEDAHHKALQQHLEKLNGLVLSLQNGVKIGGEDLLKVIETVKKLIHDFPSHAVNQSREVFEKGVKVMGDQLDVFTQERKKTDQNLQDLLKSSNEENSAKLSNALLKLEKDSQEIMKTFSSSISDGDAILRNASESIKRFDKDSQQIIEKVTTSLSKTDVFLQDASKVITRLSNPIPLQVTKPIQTSNDLEISQSPVVSYPTIEDGEREKKKARRWFGI